MSAVRRVSYGKTLSSGPQLEMQSLQRTLLPCAVCLAAVLMAAAPALGEEWADLARMRVELQQTDDFLRRADAVVRPALDPGTRVLMQEARTVQSRAWEDFRAERYEQAGARTARARLIALRATELARAGEQREQRIRGLTGSDAGPR